MTRASGWRRRGYEGMGRKRKRKRDYENDYENDYECEAWG